MRERLEDAAIPRCPTCREPIGSEYAESGAHVAVAPTFVMQVGVVDAAGAAAASSSLHPTMAHGDASAEPGVNSESPPLALMARQPGRGARGRGGRGIVRSYQTLRVRD